MKRICLLASTFACAAILAGCGAPQPLHVPPEQTLGSGLSSNDVRAAILSAAQKRHWRIVSDQSDVIELAYPSNARSSKYEVIFAVHYTDRSYNIAYVSSRGLDEKLNCKGATPCLHRNVNKWVANLNMDIQSALISSNERMTK